MTEKQLRDAWVLEVQQWLNQTYSGQSGYNNVDEDGFTGWETVYGLIRALQIELGLTPADNFGDGTKAAWDSQVANQLNIGWTSNIVKLIDGAFRCKGFGNGKFSTEFTEENQENLQEFKTAAGFDNDDTDFSSMWAKALFDMSAFALVSGGDVNTQKIQKDLNKKYSEKTGILPCDGIYQRATNTALIYGVQKEIGLWDVANGTFGPTTQEVYGTLADNNQIELYDELVLLIKYALYQNIRYLDSNSANFTGALDEETVSNLTFFQTFLNLSDSKEGYPDLKTMMSLMLSSGSPNRSFEAIDTVAKLTPTDLSNLYDLGVRYVGRYLTGSYGNDFIPKDISRDEAEFIIDAGMAIIPIYQDNNPVISYYTFGQGVSDAKKAKLAGTKIGIPTGSIIYFAVDVDALDSEITSNIVPYFSGIASVLGIGKTGNSYNYGVYGTRNVCTRISNEVAASGSYLSNMSTGWSGNLGFSQPVNWTFDQFSEPTGGIANISVDKVAVSHNDPGVTKLDEVSDEKEKALLKSLGWDYLTKKLISDSFEFEVETEIFDLGVLSATSVTSKSIKQADPTAMVINFTNGVPEFQLDLAEMIGADATAQITASTKSIGAEVGLGSLSVEITESTTAIEASVIMNIEQDEQDGTVIEGSESIKLTFNKDKFTKFLQDILDRLRNKISENWGLILGCAAIAVCALLLLPEIGLASLASAMGELLLYFTRVVVPA